MVESGLQFILAYSSYFAIFQFIIEIHMCFLVFILTNDPK